MDTDRAVDPDTATFVLMGPCSDLCCSVPVNGHDTVSLHVSIFIVHDTRHLMFEKDLEKIKLTEPGR